jgi:COPI associated protein
MGLAALMATLGVFTLIELNGIGDTAAGFLAAYMIIFALLLFVYELMWWVGIPHINLVLRKNFGFLYGLKGKGFYLIFVAFLCLGLKNDDFGKVVRSLTWATGLSFLIMGVFHVFLVCVHPTITEKYRAPTAGLDRSSRTETTTTPNPV